MSVIYGRSPVIDLAITIRSISRLMWDPEYLYEGKAEEAGKAEKDYKAWLDIQRMQNKSLQFLRVWFSDDVKAPHRTASFVLPLFHTKRLKDMIESICRNGDFCFVADGKEWYCPHQRAVCFRQYGEPLGFNPPDRAKLIIRKSARNWYNTI
jgi:hypothetical protein